MLPLPFVAQLIALFTSLVYNFAAGTANKKEMHFPANFCKLKISTNSFNNKDSLRTENLFFLSSGIIIANRQD